MPGPPVALGSRTEADILTRQFGRVRAQLAHVRFSAPKCENCGLIGEKERNARLALLALTGVPEHVRLRSH